MDNQESTALAEPETPRERWTFAGRGYVLGAAWYMWQRIDPEGEVLDMWAAPVDSLRADNA